MRTREKVNKLFPGAREQTESYRNEVNMTSQKYNPPFIISINLRVPLYRLRYNQPLQIGHIHGGRGRWLSFEVISLFGTHTHKRQEFLLNIYIYGILACFCILFFLKARTGCRSPKNKPPFGESAVTYCVCPEAPSLLRTPCLSPFTSHSLSWDVPGVEFKLIDS